MSINKVAKFLENYKGDNKEVVCLCSGGIDSNVVAHLFNKYGFTVHCLFVDMGQNAVDKERESAMRIFSSIGRGVYVESKVNIPWFASSDMFKNTVREGENVGNLDAGENGTYIPLRNMILLSLAFSYAEANNIKYIACGLDGDEDEQGNPLRDVPDCHPTFVQAVLEAAIEGSMMWHKYTKEFTLLAPLQGNSKEHTIKFGLEECGMTKEDILNSWSCYSKTETGEPCGKCTACIHTKEALKALNIL